MLRLSVVVRDFNVEGVSASPYEADPPLIVDPDAVLTLSISPQGLEPVSGRHPEVRERSCPVEEQELSSRRALKGSKPRDVLILKELRGRPGPKRAVEIIPFNGKRYNSKMWTYSVRTNAGTSFRHTVTPQK